MNKIAAATASVLFAVFGLVIALDYFLPYSQKTAEIESILREKSGFGRKRDRSNPSYNYIITVDGEKVSTDRETFNKDNGATTVQLYRTQLLRKVIKLEATGFPIHIREAPFAYFPLVPFLFVLPALAFWLRKKAKFMESVGVGSLVLACILLVMSLT